MSDFKLKNQQDIEDFLAGCAFFGTGGGGDVKSGRVSLNNCLDMGLDMTLLAPEDIKDDGLYCSPFFVGSIAPRTAEIQAEMEFNGYTNRKYHLEDMLIEAVQRMEKHLGRKVDGLMVIEMGGSNSACCMAAAYKMGLPIIDGDTCGRAIPEASNGIFAIRGYSSLPLLFVDSWGSSAVVTETSHLKAQERICKYLSQTAYGEMAVTGCPHTGTQIKSALVDNSLSRALAVGAAINRATEKGEDPLPVAARAAGGRIAAKGIITRVEPIKIEGYYCGNYMIQGMDEYKGKEYKIWFKNENHILWVDGVPQVTSPDLISLINLETGAPLLNTYLAEGIPVGVIVSPGSKHYQDSKAIAAFGPRFFGFDFDYVPYNANTF